MINDETKRKIRKLKKMECKIRFGDFDMVQPGKSLVWDEFFSLNGKKGNTRYSQNDLDFIDKESFKDIISEFYYCVYYRFYRENGIFSSSMYDPEALRWMNLPVDADSAMIKRRFRELAKKYHPDTGGDEEKFVILMENYDKLF